MAGLQAAIAKEEFWSSMGYWILVAGLVGDIIVLVVPSHRDRLEKVLAAFFTIVIIVGVAIEHRADAAISVLVSQEEDFNALQVKQSDERAKNIEHENLKLRAAMADRNLTPDQQRKIGKALTRFAGKTVV